MWYAFGGALGPRYREWVLHDLTCPTRWPRQLVRAIVQVLPLAVVVLVALGSGWVAWAGVGCGLGLALIYSIAYFEPAADHRLAKHGYPPGTAKRILSARDNARHPDRMGRYMATYRSGTTLTLSASNTCSARDEVTFTAEAKDSSRGPFQCRRLLSSVRFAQTTPLACMSAIASAS